MGAEVNKLLGSLQEEKSLKVWSLIITFFGDAVVARGGNVSAKTVQSVLSGMNVGEGAVRTAFSRLVSDEWIVRNKIGRESFYELADDGYRPFNKATARIYSPAVKETDSGNWTIAIKESGSKALVTELPSSSIQINQNCWLFNALESSDIDYLRESNFLLVSGGVGSIPDWLSRKLMPEELSQGYQQLQQRFATVKQIDRLVPIDSIVIRCLLIHQWRRLLLRTPVLPHILLPDNWPEQNCRQFVSDLYHQLLPGSELWLDEYATCATGAMPPAKGDMPLRFTESFI